MTLTIEDAPSSGSEGQRRYLALLFADLSHSTSLGAAMEAEDYAALLAGWRAACREIIPRHGGIIARMQGDGVLALFGYPEARENDGRRATEAALDLHAAVGALGAHAADGAPLTVHSGIHGGWVLVSNGDIELGRFELLGDAPNIAARLSTLADADDILVSEETLGPHGQFFTTGDRTELSLKGRSERLAVYRVLGRADADARSKAKVRRGLSPFVGREQALRQLREALRLAMNGTPQCVALYGGPGMGKTRLVDELLRHAAAASCRVLRGYCESYLNAEPVQPFAQMLRALQCEEQRDPALDAVMAQAAAEGVGAMPSLLGALAQQRPLLVVIDDWQWADVASQLMLDGVLAARHPLCVVLLSRSRPDDLPSPANSVIELPPLDDADAAAIVRHLLPDADPFLVAEIHRYAGGMPLFLEELCHAAAARGSAGLAAPQTRGLAWLNGLIESRVENLPAEQAALVRAAAVMGNVFPDWLLECITGHGAHSPAVSALAAGDFLFPGEQAGTLRFKHGITRDVIYAAVGLHERKALHRRIALALQARDGTADDLPEALAYHCAAGALHPEAARHAERAGDKAMAASALDRARAQYGAALQALDAAGPLDAERQLRWCAIAQKLGMACVFDPLALQDGLATFERCAQLALASGDRLALARAEYWLGYLSYAKGLSRRAVRHCEAALDLAAQLNEERLAAQVRATLGQVLLSAAQHERALQLLDAALDSKRQRARAGSNPAVGSAYTLACKGYLLGDRGQFVEADACFGEALHLLGELPHQVAASVRHWMSVVKHWQGHWAEAERVAEQAAQIAERVKSRQQLAMGRALAGRARWMIEQDPAGLRALRDATSWIEARNGGLAMSLNHGWLVEAALVQARPAEARRHAARLFQRARHSDHIGEAVGCRALAQAAAERREFARADHYMRLARRAAAVRSSEHERAANALCQARIEIIQGRAAEARRLLDGACTAFDAMKMGWHLAQAERVIDGL